MNSDLTPSRSEEEVTKVSDANSAQSIRKTTSSGADQVAQTVATSTTTPTSQSMRTERSVGATPSAAKAYGQKKTLFHAYQIIWYVFGFVEIVLGFRFVLKLLGANPAAGFTKFVYGLSTPFVMPFQNIFHASTTNGVDTISVFEWSTLVGAIVYIALTWGIIKLFNLGKPTDPSTVVQSVDQQ